MLHTLNENIFMCCLCFVRALGFVVSGEQLLLCIEILGPSFSVPLPHRPAHSPPREKVALSLILCPLSFRRRAVCRIFLLFFFTPHRAPWEINRSGLSGDAWLQSPVQNCV